MLLCNKNYSKDIEYLHILTSDFFVVVEIKRTGMPKGSSLDTIYYWLLLDKQSSEVSRLDFIGMRSDIGGRQERNFKSADLYFDENQGSIDIKNKGKFQLYNCTKEARIELYHEAFTSFIRNLK